MEGCDLKLQAMFRYKFLFKDMASGDCFADAWDIRMNGLKKRDIYGLGQAFIEVNAHCQEERSAVRSSLVQRRNCNRFSLGLWQS